RHHFGVGENRLAAFGRLAPHLRKIGRKVAMLRRVHLPGGVERAGGAVGFRLGKARQIGFGADGGEGLPVDGVAFADVVIFNHRGPSRLRQSSTVSPDFRLSRIRSTRETISASIAVRSKVASGLYVALS